MMGTQIKQKIFMGGKKHFPPDMGDDMSYEELIYAYDEKDRLYDLFYEKFLEMKDKKKSVTSKEGALIYKKKMEKMLVNINLLHEERRNLFNRKLQKLDEQIALKEEERQELQEAWILDKQKLQEAWILDKQKLQEAWILDKQKLQEARILEKQKNNDTMDMLRVQYKASQKEVKQVIEDWAEHNKNITTVQVEDWNMNQVDDLCIYPTVKHVAVYCTQEYEICEDLGEMQNYEYANVLVTEELECTVDKPVLIEDVNDSEGMEWDPSYDLHCSLYIEPAAEKWIEYYDEIPIDIGTRDIAINSVMYDPGEVEVNTSYTYYNPTRIKYCNPLVTLDGNMNISELKLLMTLILLGAVIYDRTKVARITQLNPRHKFYDRGKQDREYSNMELANDKETDGPWEFYTSALILIEEAWTSHQMDLGKLRKETRKPSIPVHRKTRRIKDLMELFMDQDICGLRNDFYNRAMVLLAAILVIGLLYNQVIQKENRTFDRGRINGQLLSTYNCHGTNFELSIF